MSVRQPVQHIRTIRFAPSLFRIITIYPPVRAILDTITKELRDQRELRRPSQ
jgi:hypothetical protein